MNPWTPDAVSGVIDHATAFVAAVGVVIGGVTTIVKLFKHNSDLAQNIANSTPSAVTNKLLSIQTQPTTIVNTAPPGDTTVNVEPKAD